MDENEENHQQGQAEEEPSYRSKRLRLAAPDLSVTCQFGEGASLKEKTFECHGLIMAGNSQYFDNLLSSEMEESISKQVTLEDVDPGVFEKGMELLEDPSKAMNAKVEEVLKVAPFYDRFQFQNGLKLVEEILGKFMDSWLETLDENQIRTTKNPWKSELNLILDVIVFAEAASMTSLIEKSVEFIQSRFISSTQTGKGLFEVDHIKKIQTFLVAHADDCIRDPLEDLLLSLPNHDVITAPDYFSSTEFPKVLVDAFQRQLALDDIRDHGVGIKVSVKVDKFNLIGTVDSTMECSMTMTDASSGNASICFGKEENGFEIDVYQWPGKDTKDYQNGDWVIQIWGLVRGHDLRFVFPMSSRSLLPPKDEGWRLLEGRPRVKASVQIKHLWNTYGVEVE